MVPVTLNNLLIRRRKFRISTKTYKKLRSVLRIRIRVQCLFDLWIRDPGWVKKIKLRIRDPDPG
jgi:hypothetical protein